MLYRDALSEAMTLCADSGFVFTGQAVRYDGTGMSPTFRHLPQDHLIEMPVAEEFQLGHAIGLSLAGQPVVTCFPRWNFLLCAASQLVNHLDKLPLYSEYRPRVIVRVAVPTPEPLDPGPQHLGDFTLAFRDMLDTVKIRRLVNGGDVLACYREAVDDGGSWLMVEYSALYDKEV